MGEDEGESINQLLELPGPSLGVLILQRSKVSRLLDLEMQREDHRRRKPQTEIGLSTKQIHGPQTKLSLTPAADGSSWR